MIVAPSVSKRFECQRCERRFVRREHLSRHERSHTKEKPFSCVLCSQAFTRRDLLVRHNRLYHASPAATDNNRSPGSHSSVHSKESQALPNGPFISNQDSRPSHSESTTSPQQHQQYDQLSVPYAMPSNGHPPLDLGPPSAEAWGRTPDPSTVNVSNSGILMDTPVGDAWMATGGDYDEDFSSFLDNIPISSNQYSDFFNFQQPLPFSWTENFLNMADATSRPPDSDMLDSIPAPPNGHDSLTQFGSRLPSLQPEDREHAIATPLPPPPRKSNNLTNISIESRAAVVAKLEPFSNVIPKSFTLVSRHALSRYITGFVAGFHEHLPFLHIPTTSVDTASIELTLALAAVGAQYCREPEKGLELFKVAKAVCIERIRRRDHRNKVTSPSLVNSDPSGVSPSVYGQASLSTPGDHDLSMLDSLEDPDDKPIETAQALLVLMAMATWFKWRPPAREAPAIRSLLETLMRDEGLKTDPIPDDISWDDWVIYEGHKRTKFIVFCFFNLHSIVFDIPPMILNGKIDMALPCTEAEWRAPDEKSWHEARRNRKGDEPMFLQAFAGLFQEDNESEERKPFSSLGSYILIHALIQHIWLTQELIRSHGQSYSLLATSTNGIRTPSQQPPPHLRANDITALEHALKTWQLHWDNNPESSISPLSPHGPLSFNSTALLRLAYIRINIDTGPICSLGSCNPTSIATSIYLSPPITRSHRLTRAALHCAHALSIPIKLGINAVATHTRLFWSIQHALCSLECALLLTKWLESVTIRDPRPALSSAEQRLLGFVLEMVAETEHGDVPRAVLLKDNKTLAAVVVRVWARLFRADDIWEMVNMIGRALEVYANMLESEASLE